MISRCKDFLFFAFKVMLAIALFNLVTGFLKGPGQMAQGFIANPLGFLKGGGGGQQN